MSRVSMNIFRFQNSGNAVEMCIRKGSQRIACYGNAVQYDWRSTGACTNQLLATTDSVSLYLESGGSQDCIQVGSIKTRVFFSFEGIHNQQPNQMFYLIKIISCPFPYTSSNCLSVGNWMAIQPHFYPTYSTDCNLEHSFSF